jgi:hypothetical protein
MKKARVQKAAALSAPPRAGKPLKKPSEAKALKVPCHASPRMRAVAARVAGDRQAAYSDDLARDALVRAESDRPRLSSAIGKRANA